MLRTVVTTNRKAERGRVLREVFALGGRSHRAFWVGPNVAACLAPGTSRGEAGKDFTCIQT
jgi:hypothetical protein